MRCDGHSILAVDPVLIERHCCLPTEARACYRVPIGAARASYGVWVKAHKAVTHSDWPVELTVALMKKERSLGYAKIDVEKP